MGRGENSAQPVSEIMLLLVLRDFPRAVMSGNHDTLFKTLHSKSTGHNKDGLD